MGTISVSVNGGTARKVNVHSSGALTGSFLYSIIDITIPANATVTISRASGDVAVNIDKVIVGDRRPGLAAGHLEPAAVQPRDGPYNADWKALGLAYSAPEWWRDAKLGAWAHWDPQSMPEQGDWYAYDMYQQGSADYNYHLSHFGDPSVYGYKDICKNWVIDKWDPPSLMDLYVQMGAKFFMAMGSHHDNFDNWDSTYQPWNSVKVGVKKDIVGTWAKARARRRACALASGFTTRRLAPGDSGCRYGTPAARKAPTMRMQTILDGKGKWWEGMDPADLYGYQHKTDCSNNSCNNSPYGTQFMYRVDEAIDKYHPDVVYFDDHAGDSQVDLGVHMGLGSIATTILANYYNKSLAWNQGKMDVVMNMKGVGGQYNSFQTNETLRPLRSSAPWFGAPRRTPSRRSAPIPSRPSTPSKVHWHYRRGRATQAQHRWSRP